MKAILEMSREEILALKPEDVIGILMIEETEHIFASLEAFWMNQGEFEKPHVKLTSGNHSNGYINCPLVLRHPNLRMIFAQQMAKVLLETHPGLPKFKPTDWVVGSDTSATKLAGDLAKVLGCRHGVLKKGPNKEQVWQGEMVDGEIVQRIIQPDERVLHIEELMTTAFTANRVREGIQAAHSHVVKFIGIIPVLMHRSDVYAIGEKDKAMILPINHFAIENWDPKKHCLYCANGSPVVENPKQNWAKLTA